VQSSENWNVPLRYHLMKVIGAGSYGKVCQAYDKDTRKNVAIKKIKRIFEDLIDCKRLLREIAILSDLADDRVVKLYDVCVPDDPLNFTELYLVLELCDSDFKKLFKLPEFLTESHIITLLYNTLCGLKYIHSAGIYHRDLKPANCLVNRDCAVKICDFGLSRPVDKSGQKKSDEEDPLEGNEEESNSRQPKRLLTGHVVTRWYRAPELILLQENYTEQIDVWSLGCIFAELLGMIKENFPNPKERCPLFQGSTCYPLSPHKEHDKEYQYYYNRQSRDQLNVIFNILGTPSEEVVEKLDKPDAKRYVRCFRHRAPVPLSELDRFADSSMDALDLLNKMLVIDAETRITVDEALAHTLFKDVFSPDKIKVAERKIVLDFENDELEEPRLRKHFLKEVQHFHPDMRLPPQLFSGGV
jgi:mitogen-activated protein kinase 1/3